MTFENDGLLRKTGGTNTATISTAFNNQGGSIEVDGGVLSVNGGYVQGGGGLTVLLGEPTRVNTAWLSLTGVASAGRPTQCQDWPTGFDPRLGCPVSDPGLRQPHGRVHRDQCAGRNVRGVRSQRGCF